MKQLHKTKILSKLEITDNVFIIEFERQFEFKPGQIIGITLNDTIPPRLYSICSTPSDKNIAILFNIKNDGELTPSLAKTNPGDTIWTTAPHGKFTFNNEPAWWLATGTGVAPFHSMLRSGQKPLKLVHGARYLKDLYFMQTFAQIPDYIKCCSQEKTNNVFHGRLTEYLNNQESLPTHINYYICGSAEMVVDVRSILIGKGVSYNNIITEIYF